MSTPRRRVLRPPRPEPVPDPRRQARLRICRDKLSAAHDSLQRWMTRLKRAFHAVEKGQKQVARLEREIARLGHS